MKNKLIVLFILSIAVVLSITSYVIGNNDTSTSKIRDSGVQNNLIIEKIANDITTTGDEEVIITLKTEWNGLYLEPATGVTSGAMVGELERTITKDIILANLIPQVDEESYSEDITYAPTTSTTQAWQYALTTGSSYKYAKPINNFSFVADPITNVDDNGKVYEAFTTSVAYEFVIVNDKNINPTATIDNFKTYLTDKGVTSNVSTTIFNFDSTTSTSAITTLNSALNTLKSISTSNKKVILLIADKEIATGISETDKSNFINTFSNQLITNNITLFSSSILSDSTTFTINPYANKSKDRLGNPTGTYTYDSLKLYPQEIKNKLGGLIFDYDSGASQINLLSDLKNLVGLERYYQRWHIKFTNNMVDHNKWKKLLFSLNDFNLVYSATSTTPELITEVKTTTVLKKPIADAGIYFSPGTSLEILSVNPGEKYYDRYYFTNSPIMINFTNPNEKVQMPFWNPSNVSSPVYRLEFEVFKFGATETIPNGAKLDSLSIVVKNKETPILDLTPDVANYKATKGRIPVSIEFSEENLNLIRAAIKGDNKDDIESRYYYLTFEVIADYQGTKVKHDITAKVDLLPPEVLGATYAQNSDAAAILKALGIFAGEPNEDKYIEVLTSADGAGNLYIRKDLSDPTPFILFNFILYDENFKTNSDGTFNLDYYKNVIHSSIASNFIGQHIVTVYDVNENESQIEVTISGELKDDTLLREITLSDGFGNKATIQVVNVKLTYLDDPVSIPVNLVNSQVNSPPHIGGNTFTFVKAKNNGIDINNYDLNYDSSNFRDVSVSDNHIVGLILPFTQDIDTYKNGYKNLTDTLSYFGNKISTENLSYKVYKAAQSYPLEMGGTVSGYNSSINLLSRNGGIKYDGIYGIENILPVNRAGGIAEFVYSLSTTRDSNVAKLTSPITNTQYVVDTIMPQKLNVHKTAVSFKDESTIYTNNVDFIVPFVSMQIDSSYPTVTYSDSIFTGNVADKNLDGKPLDIYTIQLDDFSLGLVNTNPGNLSADTSTNANTRFYTYKISNNANFTAEDLANNDNPYAGNIGNLITLYPGVNSVSYGINVKEPEDLLNNNFYFTNLMDELLSHNSFAGAASSKLITGAIGTVSKDYNLTIPTVIFDTNGEKFITTYSFTSAGWVKSELKSIVYDTEINTTNKTLPQAVLIKTGMNTWEGEINFGDIYEYVGLSNFTISGGRASNISIGDNTFTVNSSNIIMRTETAALDRSNATKKVTFTYNTSSKIPTDTVKVTLTDKLGNTGEFNLKLLISNPLYLLGTSANSNKQIKSTVDINSNRKIIIKGVTEENK